MVEAGLTNIIKTSIEQEKHQRDKLALMIKEINTVG